MPLIIMGRWSESLVIDDDITGGLNVTCHLSVHTKVFSRFIYLYTWTILFAVEMQMD